MTQERWMYVFAVVLLAFAIGYWSGQADGQRNIQPDCEEDQVLVGIGDFDGRYWSSFECGPAVDDYDY